MRRARSQAESFAADAGLAFSRLGPGESVDEQRTLVAEHPGVQL